MFGSIVQRLGHLILTQEMSVRFTLEPSQSYRLTAKTLDFESKNGCSIHPSSISTDAGVVNGGDSRSPDFKIAWVRVPFGAIAFIVQW